MGGDPCLMRLLWVSGREVPSSGTECAHRDSECPRAGLLCSPHTLPTLPPLPHSLPTSSPTLTRTQCARECKPRLFQLCAGESHIEPDGDNYWEVLALSHLGEYGWSRPCDHNLGTQPAPWKLWANASSHFILLWVSFLLPMSTSTLPPSKEWQALCVISSLKIPGGGL